MCIIIDTSVAHRVLRSQTDEKYGGVSTELFSAKTNRVKLVYGGSKMTKEYGRASILVIVHQLRSAGRALRVPDEQVDTEQDRITSCLNCQSDDQHILALALVSNARLLCTADANLMADFKNKSIIDRPRGKIYGPTCHESLIRRCCSK